MKSVESLLQRAKAGEKIEIDRDFKRALKRQLMASDKPEPEVRENPFSFFMKRIGIVLIPALVSLSLFFYFYDTDKRIAVAPVADKNIASEEQYNAPTMKQELARKTTETLPGSSLTSPTSPPTPQPVADNTAADVKEKKTDSEAGNAADETGRMMVGVATNTTESPFAAVAPNQNSAGVEGIVSDTAPSLDSDLQTSSHTAIPSTLQPEQPNTPLFLTFLGVVIAFVGGVVIYAVSLLNKKKK